MRALESMVDQRETRIGHASEALVRGIVATTAVMVLFHQSPNGAVGSNKSEKSKGSNKCFYAVMDTPWIEDVIQAFGDTAKRDT